MKKFLVILNTVGILIIAMILLNMISARRYHATEDIEYTIIKKNSNSIESSYLSYDEKDYDDFFSRKGVDLSARMAVIMAQELVFSKDDEKLINPYYVYLDEEHNVYMVFAECQENGRTYKVVICKKTASVLAVYLLW